MQKLFEWKRLAGIIIALGLLYASFHNVNVKNLWHEIRDVNLFFIISAFICSVGMNWAKGMRWREIILPVKPITKMRTFSLFHIGQMINLSLPALLGQFGRIVMLSKQEKLSKTFCLTSIMMEVLFDGVSLILIMYISSFFFPFKEEYHRYQVIVAGILGVVLVIIFLILRNQHSLAHFGKTKIRGRFPKLYEKISHWANSVSDGLKILRSKRQIFIVGYYSLLLWVFHIGIAFSLIGAFEFSFGDWDKAVEIAIVIIVINTIMLLVPLSPGNVGTFQFVVKGTLVELFKIAAPKALAFSLVMHFMDIVPVFIVGIPCLIAGQLTFSKLRDDTVQEARKEEETKE